MDQLPSGTPTRNAKSRPRARQPNKVLLRRNGAEIQPITVHMSHEKNRFCLWFLRAFCCAQCMEKPSQGTVHSRLLNTHYATDKTTLHFEFSDSTETCTRVVCDKTITWGTKFGFSQCSRFQRDMTPCGEKSNHLCICTSRWRRDKTHCESFSLSWNKPKDASSYWPGLRTGFSNFWKLSISSEFGGIPIHLKP